MWVIFTGPCLQIESQKNSMLQDADLKSLIHSSPCEMSNFFQNTSKMRQVQYYTVDIYEFSYFEMVIQWEWAFEKYILVEISMQDPSWVWFLNLLGDFKITKPILSTMGTGCEKIISLTLRWRNSFLPTRGFIYVLLYLPISADSCWYTTQCIPKPCLAGKETDVWL